MSAPAPPRVLLTTPDYPPKWGGLSTHTVNVEKVLSRLGIGHEVLHWRGYGEVRGCLPARLDSFTHVLNIHSGFHMFMPPTNARVINFINGAEILFYSPHPLKRLAKRLLRPHCLRRLESADKNIFISEHTRRVLVAQGLRPDYGRDLIFHMCVDTADSVPRVRPFTAGVLRFVCVARDVPHKNFAGVLRLCEAVRALSGREVELHTVTNRRFESATVKVVSHINPDNAARDRILADAHFNVLLSLDHSDRGFFEGFGQIVQEAGRFATPSVVLASGGLPESVHHGATGWVLPNLESAEVARWWQGLDDEAYERVAAECARHTLASHGLDNWERLFGRLIAP